MFSEEGVFHSFFFQHVEEDILVAGQYKNVVALACQCLHYVLELVVVLWVVEFENIPHCSLFSKVLITLAGEPTATQ